MAAAANALWIWGDHLTALSEGNSLQKQQKVSAIVTDRPEMLSEVYTVFIVDFKRWFKTKNNDFFFFFFFCRYWVFRNLHFSKPLTKELYISNLVHGETQANDPSCGTSNLHVNVLIDMRTRNPTQTHIHSTRLLLSNSTAHLMQSSISAAKTTIGNNFEEIN